MGAGVDVSVAAGVDAACRGGDRNAFVKHKVRVEVQVQV